MAAEIKSSNPARSTDDPRGPHHSDRGGRDKRLPRRRRVLDDADDGRTADMTKCNCGAETTGKWADIHENKCAIFDTRELVRGSDLYSPAVKRAMERFWAALDKLDPKA